LAIIMFGAVALILGDGQGSAAAIPGIVGVVAAFVAYGRMELAPHRRRGSALMPATV
jgi:hypothetical protein